MGQAISSNRQKRLELHVYYSRNRLLLSVWPETHLSTSSLQEFEILMYLNTLRFQKTGWGIQRGVNPNSQHKGPTPETPARRIAAKNLDNQGIESLKVIGLDSI